MAMSISRCLLRVVVAYLMRFHAFSAKAADTLNVMHVRFDTVTVHPGDTAIVNVYYTFTAQHPHGIRGYTAHFSYDTNEVFIDYITAGTASAGFWDTIGSRHGFAAFST